MWHPNSRATWWPASCRLLCAALLLAAAAAAEVADFIATNTLPDGEVETRILYHGIIAKETALKRSSGLRFRQLAPDSKRLVQLIYEDDALKDCEMVHRRDDVEMFLTTFRGDLKKLAATGNLTMQDLEGARFPPYAWFNYTELRQDCRRRHREIKEMIKQSSSPRSRRERSLFIIPGTLWCGHSQTASTYTQLGPMSELDRCCRRHDHCKWGIPGSTTKYHYHNLSPFTLSHCSCDRRHRRDIADLLRVPGTKWCGKGYSADKYTRLGGFSSTDKCCRRHDLGCPFWIGAFDTKYGLFNWRVGTIMHCSCDERFRACLKMVDSSDANLVGKLFFNVVQSKCFVLKPKKRCTKHSWWGKCEKYRYEKRALLRDNLPY